MIKATARIGDRQLLVIGLSFGNLAKFLAEPGQTFIKIDGKAMDLPIDVMIFSGETEEDMAKIMPIGPDTKVHRG
jgi:predicted alpha/beta-fold hydrolase